jgi:hypothetical protein
MQYEERRSVFHVLCVTLQLKKACEKHFPERHQLVEFYNSRKFKSERDHWPAAMQALYRAGLVDSTCVSRLSFGELLDLLWATPSSRKRRRKQASPKRSA